MSWTIRYQGPSHGYAARWAVGHYAPPLERTEHPYSFEILEFFESVEAAVNMVHYLNGGD
jgi:hypothetical protein